MGQFGNSFIPGSVVQGLGLAEGHRGLSPAQPVTERSFLLSKPGLTSEVCSDDTFPTPPAVPHPSAAMISTWASWRPSGKETETTKESGPQGLPKVPAAASGRQ